MKTGFGDKIVLTCEVQLHRKVAAWGEMPLSPSSCCSIDTAIDRERVLHKFCLVLCDSCLSPDLGVGHSETPQKKKPVSAQRSFVLCFQS